MNKIRFIVLCLSFAMVIGVFLALGEDVYRKMKGVNMSFLVYHKRNVDDTPIDLTFDGKKFIAVLSSQYTKEDLQKLVDDGVLIPEMLNFAQKRVESSFMLNEYKFNRILEANIDQLGFERAMVEVVFPLLEYLTKIQISKSNLRSLQEALRVSRVNYLSADIPPSMVDVSSISANVDFLNTGLDNSFILEARSNLFQSLMVLFVFWVADNCHTTSPCWFLGAEEILVDRVFYFLNDSVNTFTNLL